MSHMTIGLIGVAITMVLLVLRVPVGVCLGIGGFLGLLGIYDWQFATAASQVGSAPFFSAFSFELTVIPLFIMMGHFAYYSGLGEAAYTAAYKWFGRMPGGLFVATMAAATAFGASCGASLAASAIFTKISLPSMLRYGYNKGMACGAVTAGACLTMLIPPSTLAIIYGLLGEKSIGKIFIGGIGPGLMYAVLFSGAIILFTLLRPEVAPRASIEVAWRERLLALKDVWGVILLAIVILGGIYSGVFTPTEAGAVAALVAFIMYVARRRFTRASFRGSLLEAGQTTAMLFLILMGAMIFSRMLGLSGITPAITRMVVSLDVPPTMIFVLFLFVYLLMGCIMDSISMLSLTLSIVLPLTEGWGFDPTWTALVIIIMMEVGLLTPPMGLNVYVVKGVAGDTVTLDEIFKGSLFYVPIFFLGLAILFIFPQIVTWLPGMMFKGG